MPLGSGGAGPNRELLSGLVVAFALIPEANAFSGIAGVDPRVGLPQVPLNLETLGLILPAALAISLVGLMETFLTQDLLDDLTDSTSSKDSEARGQGVANIVSSLFGGMTGCALVGVMFMVAASTANFQSQRDLPRSPKVMPP